MSNIVEVSGLNKTYKNFALTNVSFALPEGCITGFIGINGAGKTTTIRSILALAQRDSGAIKMFGMDMARSEKEIKDRLGVVLDSDCFYDNLTMAEMKSVIAPAYSKWSDTDFKDYMIRFSLDSKQKIATLSKGMRMKFALALALSHNAELLIMDEPTSGLDPLIRSQLLDILTDYMKRDGKGVFFSTHITSDLDKTADMLILIDKGKILFEKEKDDLLENHRIVKGDSKALNAAAKQHFLRVSSTEFGFTGITARASDVQRTIPDVLIERPTIEDIMLAYIDGGVH